MKKALIISALCVALCQCGRADERYVDRNIPAKDRLDEARAALLEEIRNPAKPCRGLGGGMITHEYRLAQFVRMLNRIVNYCDQERREWRNDPVGFEELTKMMAKEENPVAKEIMKIALACCGDRSHDKELIEIIQRKGEPTLRCFTIEALGNNGCIAAIPALVRQLEDPDKIPAGCLRVDGEDTVFPVRDYSARALRRMGVKVQRLKGGDYQVDQASLKEMLKKAAARQPTPSAP